jgi:hypothetical protein
LSPEQREKIGNSLKGHPCSEETRAKISVKVSAKLSGRTLPREHREKIAAAGVGRVHSKESREKMSKVMRTNNATREAFRMIAAGHELGVMMTDPNTQEPTAEITDDDFNEPLPERSCPVDDGSGSCEACQ